jgi:hypothetical protein
MATGMELVKRDASRRGYTAAVAVASTTALFFIGWWWMALMGMGASAFLVYRWFAFRAKWGMRF